MLSSNTKFFIKECNKSQFIDLTSRFLSEDHRNVINCAGEADTAIVETTISQVTAPSDPVVVVTDDTDSAIMLLYYWKESMADIIFYQERLHKGWGMKSIVPDIEALKDHLLFIHICSGCDTVSALFEKGKTSCFQMCEESEELKDSSIYL